MASNLKIGSSEIMEELRDYATGKIIKNNPEEKYRQEFEHILIDELGYPKEHIDIEVTIQRGSNRKAEKADIVVYNDKNHVQENAYIVIEIETPKKAYDLQAISYVTATTAPYSVWYGGMEKVARDRFTTIVIWQNHRLIFNSFQLYLDMGKMLIQLVSIENKT